MLSGRGGGGGGGRGLAEDVESYDPIPIIFHLCVFISNWLSLWPPHILKCDLIAQDSGSCWNTHLISAFGGCHPVSVTCLNFPRSQSGSRSPESHRYTGIYAEQGQDRTQWNQSAVIIWGIEAFSGDSPDLSHRSPLGGMGQPFSSFYLPDSTLYKLIWTLNYFPWLFQGLKSHRQMTTNLHL